MRGTAYDSCNFNENDAKEREAVDKDKRVAELTKKAAF
jgi:hypothetical protein